MLNYLAPSQPVEYGCAHTCTYFLFLLILLDSSVLFNYKVKHMSKSLPPDPFGVMFSHLLSLDYLTEALVLKLLVT